jgi:hypothetical protein
VGLAARSRWLLAADATDFPCQDACGWMNDSSWLPRTVLGSPLGVSCVLLPLAADATRAQMRRPKRRLAAALAIYAGAHRVRHLRTALGELWSRWLLSFALGIPRYLPLFVHICPGSLGRSGLAWVPLRAGAGYGQPAQVKIHAGMGLDRCAMVAWRGGAVCASPDSSCACSRAGITQANLAFWALEQAVATQLRQL